MTRETSSVALTRARDEVGPGSSSTVVDDTPRASPATGAAARATPRSGMAATARATPLILPPAKVDEELAAEAARIRRQQAGARGERVPAVPAAPVVPAVPVVQQGDADVATAPTPSPRLSVTGPARSASPAPAPPTGRQRFRRPRILLAGGPLGAAPPDPTGPVPAGPAADGPAAPAELTQAAELAAVLRDHPGAAAAFSAAAAPLSRLSGPSGPSRQSGPIDPREAAELAGDLDDLLDDDLLLLSPPRHPVETDPDAPDRSFGEDDAYDVALDRSVADIATSVIASMRAVGEANERHLEAIELAAARRCELLTAQAELDAELIRLHARREAHAIISAARLRAGEEQSPVDADRLSEIGETFTRFAESIETTIASGPMSPDTLRTT